MNAALDRLEVRAVFGQKARPTWTETFAGALVDLAERDERVTAITAAMPDGTGLVKFREKYPDRYVDVGISESHAVAMAAAAASRIRSVVEAILMLPWVAMVP